MSSLRHGIGCHHRAIAAILLPTFYITLLGISFSKKATKIIGTFLLSKFGAPHTDKSCLGMPQFLDIKTGIITYNLCIATHFNGDSVMMNVGNFNVPFQQRR